MVVGLEVFFVRVSEDIGQLGAVEGSHAGCLSVGAYVREAVEEGVRGAGDGEGVVEEVGVGDEAVGGGVGVFCGCGCVGVEDGFAAGGVVSIDPGGEAGEIAGMVVAEEEIALVGVGSDHDGDALVMVLSVEAGGLVGDDGSVDDGRPGGLYLRGRVE